MSLLPAARGEGGRRTDEGRFNCTLTRRFAPPSPARGRGHCTKLASVNAHDPETAAGLKKIARMIAFNVGANSWPGWGDDGVEISPDQRQAGSEAATLSLRLVNELNLGPSQIGKACHVWLPAATGRG